MSNNFILALTISLFMTGLMVFIVRPAWNAWAQSD
ncbi:hypothetical protein AAKU67_002783 [Oxalobacteraceae bacterium GrIS 2.11]